MLERMEQEKYPLPSSVLLSTDCTDFLRRMLKPNPAQRLTLEGVLAHPWFLKKLPPHAQVRGPRGTREGGGHGGKCVCGTRCLGAPMHVRACMRPRGPFGLACACASRT